MEAMKLTDTELSAILSEAEGGGLSWTREFNYEPGNDYPTTPPCPGDVVATIGRRNVTTTSAGVVDYFQSDRGIFVSRICGPKWPHAPTPARHKARNATQALAWMRRAGLL